MALEPNKEWSVYIIESSDGTFYTGITNNPGKRWQAHLNGTGAKFFRGRTPISMCLIEDHPDRSSASKREAAIKKLTRAEKQILIHQQTLHPN